MDQVVVAQRIPAKNAHNKQQRVSTQEIKNGLERIRKAQEQVLEQLRRNQQDEQYQFNQQVNMRKSDAEGFRRKTMEAEELKRVLEVQKQRSHQKSNLYRRRVVDLQSSLALHSQNQDRLLRQIEYKDKKIEELNNKILEIQKKCGQQENQAYSMTKLQQKCWNLQISYSKLLEETEKSTKNVRRLEQEVVNLNKQIREQDTLKLKSTLQKVTAERDTLITEKTKYLKNSTKVESQYLKMMQQYSNLEKGISQKELKGVNINKIGNILVDQLHLMNEAHEATFSSLKKNVDRLSKFDLGNENNYQNSLNKMTQILQKMQQTQQREEFVSYLEKAAIQEKVSQIVRSKDEQLTKKITVQLEKMQVQKQLFKTRQDKYQEQLGQIARQNKSLKAKIQKFKEDNDQHVREIQILTKTLQSMKIQAAQNVRKRSQSELFRQQNKEGEYQTMINELSEQMDTIKKQKKDLDSLLLKIVENSSSQEDVRYQRKIGQILEINEKIKGQNVKIKQKYESTLLEKENLYLQTNQFKRQIEDLMRKMTIEVLQRQKMANSLNSMRNDMQNSVHEKQQLIRQIEKQKSQIQTQKNLQNNMNTRLREEIVNLRRQLEIALHERRQLKQLKIQFEMLKNQNNMIGKRSRGLNDRVDHLWSIKQVQYQNIVQIIGGMKP